MPYTLCVHPVPSPDRSALNSALVYYDPEVEPEQYARVLGVPETTLFRVSRIALSALYVIRLWGMRACEYLDAQAGDVLDNDLLFVGGRKGSASYQVLLPGITQQFEHDRIKCPGRLVSGLSYHRLWQSCVSLDIGELLTGHKNASRTHLSRHQLVSKVIARGESAAGDLLHHKSKRSIHYYMVRKEQCYGSTQVRNTRQGIR